MNRTLISLFLSSSLSSPFITTVLSLQLPSYNLIGLKAFRHFNSYFFSSAYFRQVNVMKSSFNKFLNTPIKINGANKYFMKDFDSTLSLQGYTSVIIDFCTFSNCHTKKYGGAIVISDMTDVFISKTYFHNCGAESHYAVMYIYAEFCSCTFSYCCFHQAYLPESIESQGQTHEGAVGFINSGLKLTFIYCTTTECPKTCASHNYQLYFSSEEDSITFTNCNISDGWSNKVSTMYIYTIRYYKSSVIKFNTFYNIKSGIYGLEIEGLIDNNRRQAFSFEKCNFVKFRLSGKAANVIYGVAIFENCNFLDISGNDTYFVFSYTNTIIYNITTDVPKEHISKDDCAYFMNCTGEIHFNQHWTHKIDFIKLGECRGNYWPTTPLFTQTVQFTQTSQFTASIYFSKSDQFTTFIKLARSSMFSNSKKFSPTSQFNQLSSCESSSRDNENGNDINNNNDGSNDQNGKNKDKSNTVLIAAVGGVIIFLLVAFIIALIVMITVYKASKHTIESDSGISIKSTNSSSDIDKTSVNPLEVTEDDCVIIDPNSIDDEGSENIIARQFDISTFPIISIEGGNCSNDEKQRDMIVQGDSESLHPIVFYDAKNNIDDKQEEIEKIQNSFSLENEETKEVLEDEVIPRPVRKKRPGRRKKKVIKEELLDSNDDVEFSFTRPEAPRKVDEIDPQASFVSFDPINDEESVRPKKKRKRINRNAVPKNESILTDITDTLEDE